MSNHEALVPPESVVTDPDAVELIRIWWSKNEPAMVLRPAFQDPRAFGAMLAHAASHMAYAYQDKGGVTEDQAHLLILEGFRNAIAGPKIETVVENGRRVTS